MKPRRWTPLIKGLDSLAPAQPKIPKEDSALQAARAAAGHDTEARPQPLFSSPTPAPAPFSAPPPGPGPILPPDSLGPLKFGDPSDLFTFIMDAVEPYKWQTEIQMQLGGIDSGRLLVPTIDAPIKYNLIAANGSGKDHTIIAAFAAWFCCTKVNSKVVITSASYDQLKTQTFFHLQNICNKINSLFNEKIFDIVEFLITCKRTNSRIKLFVSDDPGKVEGQHSEGGEFAVIVNEAKNIPEPIYEAMDRFTGWNYWIMVSSTGGRSGRFYKSCVLAKSQYPERLELGRGYTRKIVANDCPHLLRGPRIQDIIDNHGPNSRIYRSSINSEFTDDDEESIIASESLLYTPPEKCTFDMPKVAGLDIGLGGDPTILDIWQGNFLVAKETSYEANAGKLHHILISWFLKHNLKAEHITADYGGIGRPIVMRLVEDGWEINHINNEGTARNKAEYLNRGAEIWYKLKRLIEEKVLVLPIIEHGELEDVVRRNELISRRYTISNGKVKIEGKRDMKARGVSSPNIADAMALAFAFVDIQALKSRVLEAAEAPARINTIPFVDIEALYRSTPKAPTSYGKKPANGFLSDKNNSDMFKLLCQSLPQK